jgi:serine/threonine-protein kinase HipA
MKQARCLYCYRELPEGQTDFHPACSKRMFGTEQAPVLPYTKEDITLLAEKIIRSHTSVPGVQPKLSLDIQKKADDSPQRLTLVGLWGQYILKPQTAQFPHLPELEDLTMHLATLSRINTVPHSLIRFADGDLCYITRRIDRDGKGGKLHMEDMCQLTERLTEHKYRGSYEQIGKAILKYSTNPMLDMVNFLEQALFCYLTGNADMHLKNFSLIKRSSGGYTLSPAYDMLSTAIAMPEDKEELALTLNGKKNKIKRKDFEATFHSLKVEPKTGQNIFSRFAKSIPLWSGCIESSFLPEDMKEQYKELIGKKAAAMGIFG